MTEITEATWRLATLPGKFKKADLWEIGRHIPREYRPKEDDLCGSTSTKAGMVEYISLARKKWYANPPPKFRKRSKYCAITAAECNEWLRSLPPQSPCPKQLGVWCSCDKSKGCPR